MPDKKINITGREAFDLGLIDKSFSGSVRRSESEIMAARNKKSMPKNNSVQFSWSPSEGTESFGKKWDAASRMLNTINGNKPSKPSAKSTPAAPAREKVSAVGTSLQQRGIGGKVDFKSKGAISTAAGGSTDYSLGYTPGLIKYKGSYSELGLKADTSGLKAQKPMAAEPTKKQMRQARRIERLEKRQEIQRQKGEQALSEGRTMDARQKRYRYNRLQERIDRNKSKM